MQKRKGIYYFRKKVPERLQRILKRREFVYSLKTKDPLKAVILTKLYECYVEQQIIKAKMTIDFKNIKQFTTKSKFDSNGQLIEIEKSIDPSEIRDLLKLGVSIKEIQKLMDAGLFSEVVGTVSKNDINQPISVPAGKTLLVFVDDFYENKKVVSSTEVSVENKAKLRRLIEILGSDKLIDDITLQDAGVVRDSIAKLPKNSNKYRGKTVNEIIEALENEEVKTGENVQRFSPKHVMNHMSYFRGVFDFALDEKWVNKNEFSKIEVAKKGGSLMREQARLEDVEKEPFGVDDLSSIFSTSIYTDFSKSSQDENYKYWLPLIGLYTGTRIAQIASLDCDDIKQVHGVWVICFNVNNNKKSAKNIASVRLVPIHNKLLELGIVNFANRIKNEGHSRLFPELSHWTKKDGYSRKAGKWFVTHLKKIIPASEEEQQSFHCFRSTLITNMRKAGIDEPLRNKIGGWNNNADKENVVVRKHYTKFIVAEIKLAVDKIDFNEALKLIKPFDPEKSVFGKKPGRNQYTK
jgi:integrase